MPFLSLDIGKLKKLMPSSSRFLESFDMINYNLTYLIFRKQFATVHGAISISSPSF